MMGLGVFHDAESVSPVRSNIACLCDLQTAFMLLLKARWMAVIDLYLIDSFSMVENTPNPSEPITLEASDAKIILEAMECRLTDNQDHVLMYMTSLVSDLLWYTTLHGWSYTSGFARSYEEDTSSLNRP